ncbi:MULTISPECIES: TlyA family RNA methyltransferase [unclassified Marinobacterium]|uniref:TlyA family RNA methyltransferase n=1 Tax=unclassified Marinobacterium TaxID=2644139 RepID=UPI0015684DDD|nr:MULTISPECIES: TlyA family RNA methyltransferase [unclassified Marinobacterium]NRP10314.1 16S/23S rRNA (cytidine-2'-O)-methyltransferase TlyA [Marinobacterium sp. xm-g-48]NRP83413.1 16S/23S rRNA (cytidine-2'-O)-methyltransferase TlyA [Marinobacterium sp. xm-d-509]
MKRADQLLLDKGLCDSRTQAQRNIKEGRVSYLDKAWRILSKPGIKLPESTEFQVTLSEVDQYVSRGALKLKGAVEICQIDLNDVHAIDVGQSTGGFTDYLVQQGAASVLGIEVGHDQLAQKLRSNPKVTCLEGYNARELKPELKAHSPTGQFDLAVMDVSFISQTLILPGLCQLLDRGSYLVTLVKPQFELGKEHIGKGGIVKSTDLYKELEERFKTLMSELEMRVVTYIDSPIKGGDGNHEFLLVAVKDPLTQ